MMNFVGLTHKPWTPVYAQIDLKDCVISILDGTAGTSQNELVVKIGEGNLTYSERKNIEYVKDRGNLDVVREGDQEQLELRIDAVWEYIEEDTGETPTIEDALKQRGGASAWASSSSDACEPYAVDIEVVYTPDCSTGDVETLIFPDFRYEQLDHDLRAGTISVSGHCNVMEPTSSRAAQS
jgi:hypothetical protein